MEEKHLFYLSNSHGHPSQQMALDSEQIQIKAITNTTKVEIETTKKQQILNTAKKQVPAHPWPLSFWYRIRSLGPQQVWDRPDF